MKDGTVQKIPRISGKWTADDHWSNEDTLRRRLKAYAAADEGDNYEDFDY